MRKEYPFNRAVPLDPLAGERPRGEKLALPQLFLDPVKEEMYLKTLKTGEMLTSLTIKRTAKMGSNITKGKVELIGSFGEYEGQVTGIEQKGDKMIITLRDLFKKSRKQWLPEGR